EETDVVAERHQLVHQLLGLVGAAGAGERVGEPERAGQERALAAGDAVLALLVDEAADRVGLGPPARLVLRRDRALAGKPDRTVERDPAEHLRLDELRRRAAHLPDAGVGAAPEPGDVV